MATVSGVWKWNESFTVSQEQIDETVNFTSNGVLYNRIYLSGGLYYQNNSTEAEATTISGGWTDEAYRTIDFGTTVQTVSDDFYTYLTANAVQQTTEKKYYKSFTYNGKEVNLVGGKSVYQITVDGVTYYPLPSAGLLDSNGLYLMDSNGLFLLVKEDVSSWEDPVQSGSNLSITQVYSATQSGTNLAIE